jgi:NAD(P)-dependent dehydrogenase (short-subunit alcohol dehydrogenase family)
VENGAKVYVCSRTKAACDAVAAALTLLPGPGTAVSAPFDLRTDANCRAAAACVEEDALDVLVNNAGATWGDDFETFPEKAWDKVMTLNVTSVFQLTRALRPKLAAASRGNMDPSHVINIGSIGGELASPYSNNPSYLASKAAVAHLTRYLAAILLADAVNVNCIAPGVFPSKMTYDYQLASEGSSEMAARMHPVGRVGAAADMGALAIYLSSRASAFVTGQVLNLDGGSTAIRSSM